MTRDNRRFMQPLLMVTTVTYSCLRSITHAMGTLLARLPARGIGSADHRAPIPQLLAAALNLCLEQIGQPACEYLGTAIFRVQAPTTSCL